MSTPLLRTWVAPAVVALVAALAVGRLVAVASGPALAAGVAGVVVATLVGRRPLGAVLGGAGAVVLVSLWTVLGRATLDGLPTPTTARSARTALSVAHRAFAAGRFPLAHDPGTALVAALTAGVVALAVRLIGSRWVGTAVVASGLVLAASTVALPTVGAGLLAVVLGLGAVPLLSGPGARDPARAALVVLAAVLAVVAAVASSVIGSGGTGATTTSAPVPVTAASLTTDLDGIVRRDAAAVLFRAQVPYPTYWQVTLLTTYRDGVWVPGPAPTTTPDGAPRGFTARVALAAFHGSLLPSPPDPISARGGATVTERGAVVATGTVRTYTVRAHVPTAVTDTAAPGAGPAADTALPPLPGRITMLARGLTAGEPGALDKAEALVDYLRSGAFHYTVTPPPPPTGADPVVGFLFDTRRGSCQQFASAFAVLARAAGLPTRVAVGFTSGHDTGGQVTVRGVDAHAWPQVDIGGRWVSFEPTPSLPAGESLPAGVLGPAALGPAATPVPATLPTSPGTVPHFSPPSPQAPHGQPGPAGSGPGPWTWALLAVLLGLLVTAGAVAAARAVRRRRPAAQRVAGAWHRVDGALRRAGCPRPPSVTPRSHLDRVLADGPGPESRVGTRRAASHRTAARELGAVAVLLEATTFAGVEVTADDAVAAERAVRRGRSALRRCRPLT